MIGGPPELNDETRKAMRSLDRLAFVVFVIFAAGLVSAVYVWGTILSSNSVR